MKNTYIIIAIIILIAIGGFFISKNQKVTSPPTDTDITTSSPMPAPGFENVPEMIVEESGAVKEFTVEGKNFSFTPSTIAVNQGDTVKITFNATQGFHDFRVEGYGVGTKQMQAPGTEVLEFVADKAGTFEYYCSVGSHRQMGMKGTLIVQ
jgi:plastocyanin